MGGGGEGETNVNCSAPTGVQQGRDVWQAEQDSDLPTRPCNLLMSPSNPFESYPANVVVNVSSNVPLVHPSSAYTWQSGIAQPIDPANADSHLSMKVLLYSCMRAVVSLHVAFAVTARPIEVCLMGASGGGVAGGWLGGAGGGGLAGGAKSVGGRGEV